MARSLLESLLHTLALVEAGKLDAHPFFCRDNLADLLEICNACGAAGSRLPVPQTAWGMNLKPMCHIHDVGYEKGETNDDKEMEDRRMRNNGHRLVRLKSVWFLKPLRRLRIQTYYVLVHNFGGEAFWDGKLEETTID